MKWYLIPLFSMIFIFQYNTVYNGMNGNMALVKWQCHAMIDSNNLSTHNND